MHGILNDGFPFFPCMWPWPTVEFANLKNNAVGFGGVIQTNWIKWWSYWGLFQSETGRSRAQIVHWVTSGNSQCCSPGLVLSHLSPSHPGSFLGAFIVLYGVFSLPFNVQKEPSLPLIFLAVPRNVYRGALCAITASWSDGPCFGVEVPISQRSYSILSRKQQCPDLTVLFFQNSPSSSDGKMPRTIGTNKYQHGRVRQILMISISCKQQIYLFLILCLSSQAG